MFIKVLNWLLSFLATELFGFKPIAKNEVRKESLRYYWNSLKAIENNDNLRNR